MRVLGYLKFKLSSDDREQLLADYLPCCRAIRIPADLPTLPKCRDPDDQIFIELAAVGRDDFLVTGDKDLLDLAPEFDRPILSVEAFFARLNQT